LARTPGGIKASSRLRTSRSSDVPSALPRMCPPGIRPEQPGLCDALRPCPQALLSGHALRPWLSGPCSQAMLSSLVMHGWSGPCLHYPIRPSPCPSPTQCPLPTPPASTPPASTPPASTPPASTSLLPAPSHPMACFYPIPMLGLLQCRACRHAPCHAWLGSKHEPTHSQTPHPRGTTPRSTGKGQGPALWPKSGP